MRSSVVVVVLVAVMGGGAMADLELLLLHNNDMHARFEETARNSATCKQKTPLTGPRTSIKQNCVGGFARTAHEVRRYRKLAEEGGRPVLFLNAGDTYVGTAWFSVHKWKICADFLNLLKPDAMSLGNHEFDTGVAGLAPLVDAASFPIIGANLNFVKEPTLNRITKSVVIDVKGHKVGIIGYLTPDTQIISLPGNVVFTDVVEAVRAESEVLDKQGVKILLALGHAGYETDKKIAAHVPLIDVVIGGHTNTFLWNGAAPDREDPEDLYPTVVQAGGKRVPVVQAYAYTKYLGRLNVTFNEKGDLVDFKGQPELLDTDIPQDADVLALLDKYRPEIDELDRKVVGKSRVVLDSTSNKCRVVECNFGNLVADSMVYYMATLTAGRSWTDTPIGLINGGAIRTTIDPLISGGNITRGEILGSLPFGNQIIALKISGANLLKTLEIGVRSNGETSKGEFIQVSGLRVLLDMSKPSFSRVVSVKVRCGNCTVPIYEPLVPERIYDVVTVSFLMGGGDGHVVLRDNTTMWRTQDLGDVDLMEWYLKAQTQVFPEEQGRITFVTPTLPSSGIAVIADFKIMLSLVFIQVFRLVYT